MYKITEKAALNPTVTKMVIEAPLIAKKAKPGQFIIVRPFEDSERIPLTVAGYDREKGTVDIIFQIVGGTTMELNSLEVGQSVHDFVGPLGRATEVEGLKKVCVVGGGVGCAIALPIARELHEQGCVVHSVVGFRSKDLLILEDEQVLAAEADHAVDDAALLVEFTGDGQRNGAAHAAADDADLLQALHLGGAAQRADEVVDALTHFEAVQLHGGAADDLEDDVHSTLLAVIACDGEGDALAVFKRAHNDKLAGLCLFGNERGFNDHLCNGGVQRRLFRDLVHCVCSLFLYSPLHENTPVPRCSSPKRQARKFSNDLTILIITILKKESN